MTKSLKSYIKEKSNILIVKTQNILKIIIYSKSYKIELVKRKRQRFSIRVEGELVS
jgi:hypothetical protein